MLAVIRKFFKEFEHEKTSRGMGSMSSESPEWQGVTKWNPKPYFPSSRTAPVVGGAAPTWRAGRSAGLIRSNTLGAEDDFALTKDGRFCDLVTVLGMKGFRWRAMQKRQKTHMWQDTGLHLYIYIAPFHRSSARQLHHSTEASLLIQ